LADSQKHHLEAFTVEPGSVRGLSGIAKAAPFDLPSVFERNISTRGNPVFQCYAPATSSRMSLSSSIGTGCRVTAPGMGGLGGWTSHGNGATESGFWLSNEGRNFHCCKQKPGRFFWQADRRNLFFHSSRNKDSLRLAVSASTLPAPESKHNPAFQAQC